MQAFANGVGFHADAQQVIGAQHIESLFFADAHGSAARRDSSPLT
jgi:hypothetical protein